ncbi:helix-turn-helix transcriptional regulator [Natronosporangium hydrolyticum]|uniref:Helix-turn-helix transcriptional regulator n=1 Tax=Natronosporangium hydrolyticum TaxID=2811111 RepID=A0A895Y8V3_9ACTN|nr:helix-turn-helix transcriptional regulator [Natronosporangium hydrolyticum]QSB14157.1 helix-turn-helix transcriptional regulator [Natronosporangium hydrolyticum]
MRELRKQRNISFRDLARLTLASKSKLYQIETGRVVPDAETAQLIDNALNACGDLARLAQLGQEGQPAPLLPRREFLGVAASAVALAPLMDHLKAGRQLGGNLVRQLLMNTARLRRLDDYFGGADTYELFAEEVEATALLLHEGSYPEATGRQLLALLSEQAQLAGWAAFDAGWQPQARHMYELSLQAAQEAGDPSLTGNAFAFLGYQRLTVGEPPIEDLTAACEWAERGSPPKVRTLLHCRRAWAHANIGDASQTQRHLDIAADALTVSAQAAEPDWVYWVDGLEHDIMTGRCWAALRRPLRAIKALEDALDCYDDTHGRDKGLYLSFLADAYLEANEIEQACAVASKAMDLCAGVGSVRPHERIRNLIGRMEPVQPAVADLRTRAEQVFNLRQLSAPPTGRTAVTLQPGTRR